MTHSSLKESCSNCHYSFKEVGAYYCRLANRFDYPQDGGNPQVLAWLKVNQVRENQFSTRLNPDADGCPGFMPPVGALVAAHLRARYPRLSDKQIEARRKEYETIWERRRNLNVVR